MWNVPSDRMRSGGPLVVSFLRIIPLPAMLRALGLEKGGLYLRGGQAKGLGSGGFACWGVQVQSRCAFWLGGWMMTATGER